ncbi:MAG: PTS sugar transporter subunit IIA [Phycisphaerales bacterium]|nr:PTS sugar transporter subunit IIA [Phycisphaerales bacterium]
MRLTEIVVPGAVIPALASSERDEVIGELVDALIAAGAAAGIPREELVKAVLEREKRGSTGFGKGVAVPHVKHTSAKKVSLAVGLSPTGVDFNSLDKQPVYSVFLLLSPADNPEEHLKAMEVIFKNLSYDTFRRFLRQASTHAAVMDLLEEADGQHMGG